MRRVMNHIEFTLSVSKCLGCSFCPQDKLGAAYDSPVKAMTIDTFETILDKIPKDYQVHFSGFSECFLNYRASEMMHIAIHRGYEVHVYSTLIGLRDGDVETLSKARPHYIRIHVPDKIGLKIPDQKWIMHHELFLKSKIPATYMAMGEPTQVVKTYLTIRDISVERPDMLSRGGNVGIVKASNHAGGIRCTMNRWHSNVVLPHGDVVGCCMDYGMTVKLGNLITQSFETIYHAAENWKANMEKKAEGMCKHCEWATSI